MTTIATTLDTITTSVLQWNGASAATLPQFQIQTAPHRFGGVEYRLEFAQKSAQESTSQASETLALEAAASTEIAEIAENEESADQTDRTASKELGHVHTFGVLDILFTKAIREQLVAEGKVREHHYVPKSGWTTYHLNRSDAVPHALWLLRLSYVLQVLRLTKDKAFAAAELERLHVSAALRALVLPERAQNGRRA